MSSGNLTGEVSDNWALSTDIGCAFMALDGLSQSYQVLRDGRIAALLDTMIARFMEADFIASKFQTHATLAGCRSVLRYYELVHRPELLSFVDG